MTTAQFTDLTRMGRYATIATYAYVGVQVLLSVAHIYQNMIIRRFLDNQADTNALSLSDTVITSTSVFFLAVLVIVLCVNGRFIYLASRNASAITPDPAAITPGWAVGWHLVPIANIWMPFKSMKQIFTRTFGGESSIPSWLWIWWFSWVGMNLLDQILGRIPAPDNLPDYITYNQGYIISGFLWIIPAYFFLRIIRLLADAKHNPAEVFA